MARPPDCDPFDHPSPFVSVSLVHLAPRAWSPKRKLYIILSPLFSWSNQVAVLNYSDLFQTKTVLACISINADGVRLLSAAAISCPTMAPAVWNFGAAVAQELQLIGERLNYELLDGSGPPSGDSEITGDIGRRCQCHGGHKSRGVKRKGLGQRPRPHLGNMLDPDQSTYRERSHSTVM